MAYSSSKKHFGPYGGGLNYETHTLTDVATSGSNTFEVDLRTIRQVTFQNKTRAAAGGIKITTSGSTVTVTAETADDDFEVTVIGV